MRILIAASIVGNGSYEEELLAKALEQEYTNMGHQVDRFLLPFSKDLLSLPEQILAYQFLNITNCDLLITIGYPACMLKFENKISYLFERVPMLYEYWDSEYGILSNTQYANIKYTIKEIENATFTGIRKVVCNSQILREDIEREYNISTSTLYTPILEKIEAKKEYNRKFILCETTLVSYQRPELIIEAAKKMKKYEFRVFIPSADKVYYETMRKWIKQYQLEEQIYLIEGMATRADYNYALAYLLTDYNTRRIPNGVLKAIESKIPVLSYSDCGGAEEILRSYPKYYQVEKEGWSYLEGNLSSLAANMEKVININTIASFAESLVRL